MNRETKNKYIEALTSIRERGLSDNPPPSGICACLVATAVLLLNILNEKWPFHSGSWLFPIPAPFQQGGEAADEKFYDTRRGYHWKGEYGALRIEAIDFLIQELTKLTFKEKVVAEYRSLVMKIEKILGY